MPEAPLYSYYVEDCWIVGVSLALKSVSGQLTACSPYVLIFRNCLVHWPKGMVNACHFSFYFSLKYYQLNSLSSIAVHAVRFPNKLWLTNLENIY